ncbi:MAG: TIR domain-containing protein [Cyanobacteriota bacterium]|nr:TIR domain-containing protein [Cyanobacteriota bacterium]
MDDVVTKPYEENYVVILGLASKASRHGFAGVDIMADKGNKQYDLFISHAAADAAWVEGYLLDALNQAGLRCLSESSFALGASRLQEFERAVAESTFILLIISPAYLADDVSNFVDLLAQSYGSNSQTWPVIPLIRDRTDLPPRLAMLVGLDATSPAEQDAAIERLCANLNHPYRSKTELPECPYPGMLPYTEANHEQFFGRETETRQMLERLHTHPLLTVIGPSGSGKSSLVFAGLVPHLRQSSLFAGVDWTILTLRPGSKPLEQLQAMARINPSNPAASVASLLADRGPKGKLLLIIDQFEELFSLGGDPDGVFQECLKSLIQAANLFLVITVRADFYAELMRSPLWNEIQSSRLEITPLQDSGLREAIEKPAELVGVFIEPVLVERLIADAACEPGALPLVQETLVLMWDKIERRYLPLRAYEALVMSMGSYRSGQPNARSGLQVAISLRADACMAGLTESPGEQREIARAVLVRLVQFGEGRADTRRRQSEDDLASTAQNPALFQKTLDQLIRSRLLTSDVDAQTPGVRMIDIAHEALITCWPTLRQWINESRDAEIARRRLIEKAKEWKRLGQRDGGLLDAVEITEARRSLSGSQANTPSADPLLQAFLNASENHVSHARRQRRLVIGGFTGLGVLTAAIVGLLLLNRAQTETFKTMLDVQLGNVTPNNYRLVEPVLATYLANAKRALAKADKLDGQANESATNQVQYEGIRNARAVLDIIFRIQNGNYSLQALSSFQPDMERKKSEAEGIIEKLIIPYSTKRISQRLQAGDWGRKTNSTYLEYRSRFKGKDPNQPSALEATYEAIMIDLGADINRVGTLTYNQAMRIPCGLLLAIEKIWMQYTNNHCSWYGKTDRGIGGPCINQYESLSLMALIFPPISFPYVERRLDQCRVIHAENMKPLDPIRRFR